MNRREFVKALAGVPLLGFLAKLPKAEAQPAFDLCPESEDLSKDWMVESYEDEAGREHRRVIFGSPPSDLHWDSPSPGGFSYWNGQEWIGK